MKTLAIIVNYRTSDLAAAAARSVVESEHMGAVRVVVVDNSADKKEEEILRSRLPGEATLLTPSGNLGFGRACNFVLERFSGDCILLLNPDARLLPGCLQRLQKTISSRAEIAAAGPRVFWDDAMQYYLPPSCPPTYFLFAPALAGLSPDSSVKRVLSALWRRHAVKLWRSRGPARVGNLSGGHALLKTEAVRRAGGLFDPRFFMYYEDTDLFMRLRRAGGVLVHDPRAAAVHRYDQCGQDDTARKRRFAAESGEHFMSKHLIGRRRAAYGLVRRFASRFRSGSNRESVADYRAPFRLATPESIRDDWLFEWSPNPDFIPAAGRFGRGRVMEFSEAHWRMLAPGRYFGRLNRSGSPRGPFLHVSWSKE